MADFFQGLPFWRLSPNHTAFTAINPNLTTAVLATPDRDLVVAYLATLLTGARLDGCPAWLRLPDGDYYLACIWPASGTLLFEQELVSQGLGQRIHIALPEFVDDLVVQITRRTRRHRSLMPDTG